MPVPLNQLRGFLTAELHTAHYICSREHCAPFNLAIAFDQCAAGLDSLLDNGKSFEQDGKQLLIRVVTNLNNGVDKFVGESWRGNSIIGISHHRDNMSDPISSQCFDSSSSGQWSDKKPRQHLLHLAPEFVLPNWLVADRIAALESGGRGSFEGWGLLGFGCHV